MNRLIYFWKSKSGASGAEYALLLAIIGSALAVASIALGGVIGDSLNGTAECIATNGGTCPN